MDAQNIVQNLQTKIHIFNGYNHFYVTNCIPKDGPGLRLGIGLVHFSADIFFGSKMDLERSRCVRALKVPVVGISRRAHGVSNSSRSRTTCSRLSGHSHVKE